MLPEAAGGALLSPGRRGAVRLWVRGPRYLRGTGVMFAGQIWHTLHLSALQEASLTRGLGGRRSAPLSPVKHPPPPTSISSISLPSLSTLPPTHHPPSPPLCPDRCPAHPSAPGQWLTFKETQEKKRRPVSQNCLFADRIFKSSTS